MADLLTIENLGNLIMLCFLQAVLGFDNLLYISIESQRAPVAQQAAVRKWGILLAVALRVVLLFVMIKAIDAMAAPFFILEWEGVLTGGVNFATLVFIIGGIFIMYTAVKEIGHMLSIEHLGTDVEGKSGKSAAKVVGLIVLMNLIFSFDSVLSALAITDVFPILAVLGLFILLIVGIVLLGEAGQAAAHAMHDPELALRFFGYEVIPMSKTTFYFSVLVLVAVEIIQSGYTRKLNAERRTGQRH